jgi:RNA polymerase sigma-70 factor (ECF subfamily)
MTKRDDDFEELYAEHAPGLLAFLVYRTGDRALAEDVLADTFERVLKARTRFDPRRGRRKTWIYSIALNRLRDQLRRREAEGRALERAHMPAAEESPLDDLERRDELAAALVRLSPDEREALALRYGADLTVPQIARLTGEPLTTVEGRVYRGLRKLRELLD